MRYRGQEGRTGDRMARFSQFLLYRVSYYLMMKEIALWYALKMIMAWVVLSHPGGYEEHVYPRCVSMVKMFGDVGMMIVQCSLMFGKRFYVATLVKICLHQLWGAQGGKWCSEICYDCRRANLSVFRTVLFLIIYFKYI